MLKMISLCSNDATFAVGSNCRPLDFTLMFEEVILSILLDSTFVLLAALRIYRLWQEPVKVTGILNITFIIKSILSFFILGTSIAAVIISKQVGAGRITNATIASLIMTVVSSITFQPLAFFEYSRTISPSSLIIFYCLIKGLFSATRLRTYNSVDIYLTSPSLLVSFSLTTASWFIYLLAELYEKDRVLIPPYKAFPRESKGSFISRSLYLWLLPTLWRGRKSRFTLEDLTEVPNDLKAEPARIPLVRALDAGDRLSSTYLLKATLRSFGAPFFIPIIPRVTLVLGTFAQPLLIRDMLAFMSSPDKPPSKGWAIFGGFVCVYSIITIAIALYREKLYAITVKYRAALVGAIYLKTLRLASHASRPLGTGVGSNYMSVDVERIGIGMEEFYEILGAIVALPLAFALLYSEANWAAFLPIGVMIVALGITSYIAKQAGGKQTLWSQQTDKRIKLMSSVIKQLIPMKLFAYEQYISKKIDACRRDEIHFMKSYYWVLMEAAAISNTLMLFTLFTVLAAYVAIWGHNSSSQSTINVTKIFTIYSTVQLLSEPFNILGQSLPGLLAAYASLKRIQEFLTLDEKNTTSDPAKQTDPTNPISTTNTTKRLNSNAATVISLRGTFSWDKNSPTVLKDIDLDLPLNKLTICVGPVASGKTSLIIALLGELCTTSPSPPTQRPTQIPSLERVGYSAQDAFIMPGTLRENILFGRDYYEESYHQTIKACALEVDFANMQSGDKTKVTDARSLSGGQKQRIGLARAVYSRAPLTLLDDPFSALDGETAAYVFDALFGPRGLLKGRTVLLITHYVHHLPSADYVVVLEQGLIRHRGAWSEVLSSGYQLSELSKPRTSGHPDKEKGVQESDVEQPNQKAIGARVVDEHDAMDDVDDEYKNSYGKGLKPYKFWLRNAGVLNATMSMTFFFLYPALRLANQGYLKEWSESNGNNYPRWIAGLAAFAVGALVVILLGLYHFSCIMIAQIGLSVHSNEVKGLLRASTSWIQKTPAGKIINRFSQDIFEMDFTFPLGFLNGSINGWALIGSLIVIYVSSPWLALSAPPMLLAYWVLLKFYLSSSKQLQQLEVASKSPLYTVFGTTLSGLEIIRAHRADAFFLSQNDKHLNASQGPFHYRFAGMRFLKTSLAFMTFIVAVGLAGTVVGLRKSTSVPLLGMALSTLSGLTNQLSAVLMCWAIMENGTVSIARIQEIVELPSEDPGGSLPVSKMSRGWPAHGSIVFDNIKMRYAEDSPLVLKGISFTVKPGMKVGICGRTGSGKSSTVQGLFRTVDKALISGRILVDGIDITEISLSTLRGSMSIVVQEPFLWHDTVRNNLDLEGTKSDDQLWRALEQVGLKTTFSNAPEKLEMMIEDSGSLSRGERQLLCLARALLRSRRIVVLDEATSSMDLETDELVRRVIQREMKEYTVLAVAHRIATIIDFDLILVLEDGLIVEAGSPTVLLARNGRFAQLASSQGITRDSRFSLPEIN